MDDSKINLVLSGSEVFVWSADDWLKLRQEHRVVGECIGCIAKKPRQDTLSGLPMLLLPEEAKLLLEKGICQLIQHPVLKETPCESLKKKFEEYRSKLYEEQQECLIDQRRIQVLSVMDKIIEGKKRKTLGLHTRKKKLKKPLDDETKTALDNVEVDRKALIEEEMSKLPKLKMTDALVQTHTAFPWHTDIIKIENWSFPSNDEESLKYKVFKDIWEQGYYVTSGQKFGCDFLAYPGDPIMFHSQLLIHCKNRNEEMSVTELVAGSRIGSHVRKTLVFATLSTDGERIEYCSSRWADSSMGEF
ncbi:PREDICTED: tRNA-splicing endonuclease subunit Sen34 [Ceratosolen solmsi marchali]|uniref:tRNA-splicing endonuclease subunit Sen34 n=1 Tax=Ceratosolen solmsi marchali TaxID=326594 RepID=A0AAJ6YU39_9HYME|nr:PREDICTED: tRNA-splicing endonuclease subunit Sen34 [Ceratosolen solmsi marchali]